MKLAPGELAIEVHKYNGTGERLSGDMRAMNIHRLLIRYSELGLFLSGRIMP